MTQQKVKLESAPAQQGPSAYCFLSKPLSQEWRRAGALARHRGACLRSPPQAEDTAVPPAHPRAAGTLWDPSELPDGAPALTQRVQYSPHFTEKVTWPGKRALGHHVLK